MMFGFGAPIIALVIVAYVESCHCGGKSPFSYMPIREKPLTANEISWIVDLIDSGRWGSNIQALPATLKDAKLTAVKAYLKEPYDDKTGVTEFKDKYNSLYWLQETIWDFQRLSDESIGSSISCASPDVANLIDILNQKFGGLKKFLWSLTELKPSKSLALEYLKHFAPKFYSRCLNRLMDVYQAEVSKFEPDTEAKMDALVSMGEVYPSGETDIRLTVQAENLDLAKGKFDAQKMLRAVRQFIGKVERQEWLKNESAKVLIDFIRGVCKDLRWTLSNTFDVYNMARILVPGEAGQLELSTKFRKLNEYSRICLPMKHDEGEVFSNIKSNLIRQGIQSSLGMN